MVRSFLTRLLGPCLLICLACATSFPLDSLEEGMTAETVRESFGEPEAYGEPGAWIYVHDEQAWFPTILMSTVFLPHCVLLSAFYTLPVEGEIFCNAIDENRVVLYFEAEKLTRWEVIALFKHPGPSPEVMESLHRSQDEWFRQQQNAYHSRQHKKGRKHHH